MVSQRIERHGRSREIRNAHVLARCGTLDVSDLAFVLDKPVIVALALLDIVPKETAAFAANDRPPSEVGLRDGQDARGGHEAVHGLDR